MDVPSGFAGPMRPDLPTGEPCPGISRRSLVATGLGMVGAAALSNLPGSGLLGRAAAKSVSPPSETLATTLYKSLSQPLREAICFPFDDPLRLKVENNWNITSARIGTAFSPDQQEMIRQIFLGLHSPDYADAVMRQVIDDSGQAGFGDSSIAFFGTPGSGKFEFVLTGRHCTRRCDGDSVEGAAFGGPIFYGHAPGGNFTEKADHAGSAYWYQARQANRVFDMLDGRQRKLALVDIDRGERGTETVRLTGKTTGLPGIPMTELSSDQKREVRKTLAVVLAPFRKADADEALKLVEASGFDHLHIAFYNYQNADVGRDGVWDVWQIEGPAMVWYFRGEPHVHTWVHIKRSADTA